ncbi:hypothetical protein AQPE_1804 [Aquipluma nitroreducens]|uniref:Uncharacterized protein n=1 Tax=Aquipluma nitroreducens TaxID=2010828 RepID=A0A5K7S823_9BACT|nr:hypothetical protein [Aquipluma nitroreducens]BBE17647.1 hypothetical protein AQPE_1804 [Aquipluma nitroreducens]
MEKHCEHRRHSGSFWAYVLIIVGILWILKKSGWDINLPGLGEFFSGIGQFFGNLFHMTAFATVPVLIILFGILLILGRKFLGALFLVLLVVILIPHFLIIPGILMVIFFPIILIIIGIVVLSNLF